MAIEGGCGWVQLSSDIPEDSAKKEIALTLRELCEETGTIFIIDHDVELVDELKVSGVHLGKSDMNPSEAREKLGPHAIIGVDAETPEDVIGLLPADIDYVSVGPFKEKFSVDDYASFVSELRNKSCNTPVVARGNICASDLHRLLEAGVNGFAISDAIINAPDPVKETEALLSTIANY